MIITSISPHLHQSRLVISLDRGHCEHQTSSQTIKGQRPRGDQYTQVDWPTLNWSDASSQQWLRHHHCDLDTEFPFLSFVDSQGGVSHAFVGLLVNCRVAFQFASTHNRWIRRTTICDLARINRIATSEPTRQLS